MYHCNHYYPLHNFCFMFCVIVVLLIEDAITPFVFNQFSRTIHIKITVYQITCMHMPRLVAKLLSETWNFIDKINICFLHHQHNRCQLWMIRLLNKYEKSNWGFNSYNVAIGKSLNKLSYDKDATCNQHYFLHNLCIICIIDVIVVL